MITPHDWRVLRNPLLGLGAAMMLVGLLVSVANRYHEENNQALQTQQNLLMQAQQKYQSSGSEKDIIMHYLPEYNKLINQGFVGEEKRIEWIETLRQIHAQHKLFGIDYNIELQENYKPTFLGNLGGFIMHRSVMKLSLDMLHEGDLLTLLDGLHDQTTPFIVRDCELLNPGNTDMGNNLVPHLKATCQIDWITLRDPQLGSVTP